LFTHNLRGQVSIEFLLSLLILLIVVSLFISTNLKLKDKLETKINYKEYNLKVCTLKQTKLMEENGVIKYDSCKPKTEERTSNGT